MVDAYMITGTRRFTIEKIQVVEFRAKSVLLEDGETVRSRYSPALAFEEALEDAKRLVMLRLHNQIDIAKKSAELANNNLKDCEAALAKFTKFGSM